MLSTIIIFLLVFGAFGWYLWKVFWLKLVNGEELILTSSSKGLWALSEYFKNIPHQSHRQDYPIIQ